MNPGDNRANLTEEYLADLDALDERRRNRFFLGLWSDDAENALWTVELLDKGRLLTTAPPAMQRIVIAVDPSGCSGPEDLRSDEVGIVVCGLGVDGKGYVLEDLSRAAWRRTSGRRLWLRPTTGIARIVVVERNFGGALVIEVLRTAVADGGLPLAVSAGGGERAASMCGLSR